MSSLELGEAPQAPDASIDWANHKGNDIIRANKATIITCLNKLTWPASSQQQQRHNERAIKTNLIDKELATQKGCK